MSLQLKHENIIIVWRLVEVTLMSNNSLYFFLSSLLLLISLDIVLAWKHASKLLIIICFSMLKEFIFIALPKNGALYSIENNIEGNSRHIHCHLQCFRKICVLSIVEVLYYSYSCKFQGFKTSGHTVD